MYSNTFTGNTQKCLACVSPCATCQSSTHCLSCIANKFLYNAQCHTTCPLDTEFEDSSTLTCKKCIPPCLTCTDSTNCLSCTTGFL